ncbi:hypothetical protein [Lysobacter gummosus]|uniref:hypothetical protein n=1 Tax=Lysobacter gummosus TaxID=262324 RepID=UPI003645DE6B
MPNSTRFMTTLRNGRRVPPVACGKAVSCMQASRGWLAKQGARNSTSAATQSCRNGCTTDRVQLWRDCCAHTSCFDVLGRSAAEIIPPTWTNEIGSRSSNGCVRPKNISMPRRSSLRRGRSTTR